MRFVPIIHDGWKNTVSIEIECFGSNSSNESEIVFHDFKLIRDISDARRHMFSFIKKQFDIAPYYQKRIHKLKKQNRQARFEYQMEPQFT